MRIKNASRAESGGKVTISAQCKIRPFGWDTIWFRFDKEYAGEVGFEPFIAGLLVPSMRKGENLHVQGRISRKLFHGTAKIVEIMSGWNVGLKKIKLTHEGFTESKGGEKIGTFFSGGVDSFYTFLKHKAEVTHFILIRGYDISLRDDVLWNTTAKNIREIAKLENIKLIEVESNIREMIEPFIPWDFSHGGCLAAAGLCLGFKKIYVPSSYTKEQQFPWGSHLETDKFWGTEGTDFEHDGTEATRVQKVRMISRYPVVLDHLRVCYVNKESAYNCGECDKCLRTMINLYAAGKLGESKTLPHILPLDKIAALKIDGEHGAVFQRENLEAIRGNKELEAAIESSLRNVSSYQRPFVEQVRGTIFTLDGRYFKGMLYRGFTAMKKR